MQYDELMLYIVATPIGNMSDLSQRAQDAFLKADIILSEDTRQTLKILNFLGIKDKEIISCNEHCNKTKLAKILDRLSGDCRGVFCSDAGTPNVSDPGGRVVEEALKRKIEIIPIPGPSALTTLASVCPFSCSQFAFWGYFPKKKGRLKTIKLIEQATHPIFFLESPHRIVKTLKLLKGNLRRDYIIVVGRELTKYFEQIIISDLDKIDIDSVKAKGEFVLCLKHK